MRKFLTIAVPLFCFFLVLLFAASSVSAQSGKVIDLLQYYFPGGGPSVNISSGEAFRTFGDGANGFFIYKSGGDPGLYERFRFDNNNIYHLEDTTWATEAGPVKCLGTDDNAYFTLLNGNYGGPQNTCSVYDKSRQGMIWVGRRLKVGECTTGQGTVVGFNKRTGQCCETPFTGPEGGHTLCLTYQGCIKFPTGVTSEDGVAMTITAGAGAGETYYYDKKSGWVGFSWSGQTGHYATDQLSTKTFGPGECLEVKEGVGAGKEVPKNFTPTRKVETGDTTASLTDPVKFKQNSSLFPGETQRKVTRAGFFDQFKDLSIPFAQELTQYLAGPFAYQGNAVIQNTLGLGRSGKAGVLAKLTSADLQDTMRRDYWQKCRDGTYCSSQNIGSRECPTESSNECLITDGTDIQALQPPPQAGDPSYTAWQRQWSKKWVQVPLISNPKTFVDQAVKMAACDGGDSTTVTTKTPWVSALKDTSVFLSQMLLPESGSNSQAQVSDPNQGKVLAGKTLAAQTGSFHLEASASYSEPNVNVTVSFVNETCRDVGHITLYQNGAQIAGPNNWKAWPRPFDWYPKWTKSPYKVARGQTLTVNFQGSTDGGNCNNQRFGIDCTFSVDGSGVLSSTCGSTNQQPPLPAPTCTPPALPASKPGGGSDGVDISGHALLVGPKTTLTCEQWEGNKCVKGSAGDDFNTPVWPVVYYPYLETIYNALAGENGIFQAIFKPAKSDTDNWSDAGESDLNYCLASVPDYMANKAPDYWLRGGGLYPYQVPFTPDAACDQKFTQNLKVYPEKIGGVKNAQEWVIKELNP